MLLIRTSWPTASTPGPKSFSTTVCPTTTTLVPPSMSDWVKSDPEATAQLRMAKKSVLVPVTLVVQFWSSESTWAVERRLGAT